jgi:uncharacterized delta-60 repeat protein
VAVAAGDLDTTFAGNGRKAISFGGTDQANAVLVQPNGRIVVAGGGTAGTAFCVARLRGDGKLDTTFGKGGKRTIDFGTDDDVARAAALQPDGRILLAGGSRERAAIARLNADGSLDTTFSGDGKRAFSWGAFSRVEAVLPLPNAKIVLAGFSGPEGGNIQVGRMNANGAFDTAFGTGGKTPIDFDGDDFGLAAARQRNGRIVVAGTSRPTFSSGESTAVIARLRSGGALDPDFDGDGRKKLPGMVEATGVLVQPDRKIVVVGSLDDQVYAVIRYDVEGSLDPGFGSGGSVLTETDPYQASARAVAIQDDGRLVVGGFSSLLRYLA